jgi:hypothetical protein
MMDLGLTTSPNINDTSQETLYDELSRKSRDYCYKCFTALHSKLLYDIKRSIQIEKEKTKENYYKNNAAKFSSKGVLINPGRDVFALVGS